jgi:uncharacterized protein (TIGR03437 family)
VKSVATTISTVTASIDGQSAKVVFAGDAPGFVGLSQVNVIVSQGLPPSPRPGPSAVPVSLTVGGNVSAQVVFIFVE